MSATKEAESLGFAFFGSVLCTRYLRLLYIYL